MSSSSSSSSSSDASSADASSLSLASTTTTSSSSSSSLSSPSPSSSPSSSGAGGRWYGTRTFDATLQLAQIVAMQCLFYMLLVALLFVFDSVTTLPFSLRQVFSADALVSHDAQLTAITIGSFALTAVVVAVLLVAVVERARKCVDFAVTVYVLHFFACCAYDGFPSHARWWLLIVGSAVFTAFVAEYLAMRLELREISTHTRNLSTPSLSEALELEARKHAASRATQPRSWRTAAAGEQ